MYFDAADLLIEGNEIGTSIDGTSPLGNGGAGAYVTVSGDVGGGTVAGAGNIIANSGATDTFNQSGVVVGGNTNDVPSLILLRYLKRPI